MLTAYGLAVIMGPLLGDSHGGVKIHVWAILKNVLPKAVAGDMLKGIFKGVRLCVYWFLRFWS